MSLRQYVMYLMKNKMMFNMKTICAPVCLIILVMAMMLVNSCSHRNGKEAEDRKVDESEEKEIGYPITPIHFSDVTLTDLFWLPKVERNASVTIQHVLEMAEETGRIRNFEVAGEMVEGGFSSKYPFDDSDVFKIIEGASWSLMNEWDEELDNYLDRLIVKIAAAQEGDGYLYTNRTILGDSAHEMAGDERWEKVSEHSHELYNAGHLYEAAVAHHLATGKVSLLDIAVRNADLICSEFGEGKIRKYPGHQEIEIGLIKLYSVTKNEKYLDLAKFFLDVRGPGGWEYNQAHLKVRDQKEAVGHAVRALYMYSAMTDVAAMTGDSSYLPALFDIWGSIINTKLYVTGGVGQKGENEGFGKPYELPNAPAYCETCASIAHIFFNQRLFQFYGSSKYIDILERTLYNSLLSGISLTGDRFFYSNTLESDGTHERKEWYSCACCPSNIVRFLPTIGGYIYARQDDRFYVNLFISSRTGYKVGENPVRITQQTYMPWERKILIKVDPEEPVKQDIMIRVPGWARSSPTSGDLYRYWPVLNVDVVYRVNGKEVDPPFADGYSIISRTWKKGDRIEVLIPMPVGKLLSQESLLTNFGLLTLQRGPVVYCIEDKDQPLGVDVHHLRMDPQSEFTVKYEPGMLGGVVTIEAEAFKTDPKNKQPYGQPFTMKAIPYHVWANRGPADMRVWIPYR